MRAQDIVLARRYAAGYMAGPREEAAKKLQLLKEAAAAVTPYCRYLEHPCISHKVKFEILKKILSSGAAFSRVENLLKLMIRAGRTVLLERVAGEAVKIYNDLSGMDEASVYSRFELTKEESASLAKALSEYSGKKVTLKNFSKPELIGGVQIKFGDLFVDNSLKTRFELLKKNFFK